MTDLQTVKKLARADARAAASSIANFPSLPLADQKAIFMSMYDTRVTDLANAAGLSLPMSARPRAMAGPEKASDMIDDQRHLNQRIDQAGELAGEFVDEVDFPGFVKDLLTGVFDANLKVTLEQIKTYQDLLKTATQSVSKFVNAIDDTAAFGYLAENNEDEFNIDFSDNEKEVDGTPKATLTDKDGNPLDLGDNQVKAKIMEAKIAMAKEQRLLLRETILMGITRLVVEKGVVKASVLFDIKAGERIEKADKAALKESISNSRSISAGGGLIGKVFGGASGGGTRSQRKTKISVSSAKSDASTDLAAKLAGSVDITFKSDYFKLDNFAALFGENAGGAIPPTGAGAGATAPPAAAPARA